MRKLAAVALLVGVCVIASVACGQPAPTEPSETIIKRASPPIPPPAPTQAPEEGEGATEVIDGVKVTVNMNDNGGVGPFVYDPADLVFSVGEAVNFTLISEAAFHTFTVPDLDINVEVNAGEAGGLDFVFEEPGTYELVCIPHETNGMVGTITVN